jgi:hypothetical protein
MILKQAAGSEMAFLGGRSSGYIRIIRQGDHRSGGFDAYDP